MYQSLPSNHARRRGQTLAEFALTLPLLLLLIFGVVEFGRIFQAWVTIENSARESIRYTTTGQYDRERYDVDVLLPCTGNLAERGNRTRVSFDDGLTQVDVWFKETSPSIVISGDSIFSTWYEGIQCDPGLPEHLEWRQDILRLASIYDVARRGAAGLSLERSQQNGTTQAIFNMMTALWTEPMPRSDQRGYFNVMVCSSRGFLSEEGESYLDGFGDTTVSHPHRFATVFDPLNVPSGFSSSYTPPYCLLNETSNEHRAREIPGGGVNSVQEGPNYNMGVRWMDAGGPGDAVTVFVTFNHPLITPLGLAEYLTIRSYRSGVNEAFRASKAITAPSSNPPTQLGELATQPPTLTPEPTSTAVPTATLTPTPTATFTETPEPFTCDKIRISAVRFIGERMFIQIVNDNTQNTFLEQVILRWRKPINFPSMYAFALAIARTSAEGGEATEVMWTGNVRADIDTSTFTGTDLSDWTSADKSIPGFGIATTSVFAEFKLGANPLTQEFNVGDFGGTQFRIHNPVNPALPCLADIQEFINDNPTATPPSNFTPSATFTPDCASRRMRVEFVDFLTFGVIQLRVTSERNVSSSLLGFNIVWPRWQDLPRVGRPNVLSLARIKVGGSNPNHSNAVTVWTGNDFEPNTPHTQGTFVPGYQFPAHSVTNLWLDFDGYSGRLDQAIQFGPWMLHGTTFDIGCNSPGGGGGGGGGTGGGGTGGGSQGVIDLSVPTPPPPTGTPRPTNTPGPTLTPSPTRPTSTPSNTFTPGPTRTFTLTPTNTPFVIPTPSPLPTREGGIGAG